MATQPPYAPNVVNQTVDYGGITWKGQPGGGWVQQGVTGGGGGTTSTPTPSVDTSLITDALKRAAANSSDFIARFRNAITGTPATETAAAIPGMAQRIQQELGIPNLAESSAKLNTMLTNMPVTQTAAARGYDVNANQLARIIAQKSSELAPEATAVANQLAAVTPLATQRLSTELIPWQTEAGMISDQAAREVSGYTSIMQAQLDTLLEKMKEGAQLTLEETKQANLLAAKEKDYEIALKTPQTTANRYITSGGSIYDTQTGTWLKAPTTGGAGGIGAYLPTKTATPDYFKPLDIGGTSGSSATLR